MFHKFLNDSSNKKKTYLKEKKEGSVIQITLLEEEKNIHCYTTENMYRKDCEII